MHANYRPAETDGGLESPDEHSLVESGQTS
jgi:hypothetical protein